MCQFLVPYGVDSTQPQIQQRLSHTNNASPQASTVFAAFSIAKALGTGRGGVGGVHVGCLGSMVSYSYIGECSVSKNSKKAQKEKNKLLFLC